MARETPFLQAVSESSVEVTVFELQQQPAPMLARQRTGSLKAAQPGAPSAVALLKASGISFDQALTKYVGDFGPGQVFIFVIASLMWVPNAVLILLLVFTVGTPVRHHEWRCTGGGGSADAACTAVWAAPDPVRAGFCDLHRDQWEWLHPHATLTANFDLVCGQAWKAQVANSLFFVGYLIGSGVFGSVADAAGRKTALISATAIGSVFAAVTAATGRSFWAFAAMRLLTGVGAAGQALATYVLATEMVGPSWRGTAGVSTQIFFIVGEFALVLMWLACGTWRRMAFAAALLNTLFLPLVLLLPESGRWLLVQGRKDEALKVLEGIARRNRTQMPLEPLADVGGTAPAAIAAAPGGGSAATAPAAPSGAASRKLRLMDALRDRHITRRFLILAYAWCVVCMCYYGIAFASSSVGGSLYVSFCLGALAELPAYLLSGFLIERLGRHNTFAGGLLVGGVACIACAFTAPGVGQAVLAAVGKFGCAGSFAIASIYTSELFPTLIRSAVLGAENEAARVGGIVAPFIALAGTSTGSSLVPFLTFGLAALLGGLLVFTLPETLGAPLPETMDDMVHIASIFTTKAWRKGGFTGAARSMFKTKVTSVAEAPLMPGDSPSTPAESLNGAGNMAPRDDLIPAGRL